MTIESLLERIAVALENRAVPAQPTEAPAPSEPVKPRKTKATPPPPPVEEKSDADDDFMDAPVVDEEKYTVEQVREVLMKYNEANAKDKKKTLDLLEKLGGTRSLTDLKPEKFAAVIKGVKAALK